MLNPKYLIWLAGAVQLAIVAMNMALPPRLKTKENLAKVDPIVRQVFYSHWFFVMLAVAIFSVLCFAFDADMAGKSAVGRFLSAALALFWLLKLLIQFTCIDVAFRRRHRLADILASLATVYLVAVLGAAAAGFLGLI